MHKVIGSMFALALMVALSASPASAKTHSFELPEKAKLNGVLLSPGEYKLELNGTEEASIYRNKELIAKVPVQVKPRENGTIRGMWIDSNHNVRELRLKNRVIIFGY